MTRPWRLAVLGLLLFGFPLAAETRAPYPRVQIVVGFHGDIFDAIPEAELGNLKKDLQEELRKDAPRIAPCMEWVTAEVASGSRPQLLVDLTREQYGNFWRVSLSITGKIGRAENKLLYVNTGLSPLGWHPRYRNKDEKQWKPLFKTIDAQFSEELRKVLDSSFIAEIPIAESAEAKPTMQRIIVPLSARRLSLEPGTSLKLLVKAALCTKDPNMCRIDMRSDGNFDASLRCQLSMNYCCPGLNLTPELAERLNSANWKEVYLFGNHRHCPYDPDHCPGPDGLLPNP
ncbi:MAG TPA: hypothetical protein VFE33_03605 [Thermoanaerobaculia bacterium]|nr:hypothetical protein [Thermoanaerobaculia bacterium]